MNLAKTADDFTERVSGPTKVCCGAFTVESMDVVDDVESYGG